MASLKDLSYKDFLNMTTFAEIDLGDMIKSLRYVGFDTESILERVNNYINSGNEEKRREDISRLIYLGMKRGNRVSKMIETFKKEEAEWLRNMVAELNIKDNIKDETGEHSNNTLTLSRLKKACPQLTYDILKQPNFKSRVTVKMIQNKIPEFEFLPLIARDMCIMSLLPKKISEEFGTDPFSIMVHHIFIYCLCESALLVNRENSKESVKARAEGVIKYMNIMWNAEHITDEERKVKAEEMKEYFKSLNKDDMNALKNQCDLIEGYASKLGISILESFDFQQ